MGRIMAWTLSLTGGIVVVRDPCLHGRFSIGSLCVGPSDTMSWSPTIGLLITPQEPIQPRLGGRVQRLLNTFRTEVVVLSSLVAYHVVVPSSSNKHYSSKTCFTSNKYTSLRLTSKAHYIVARCHAGWPGGSCRLMSGTSA